jgi:hypothetical protein
VHFTLHKVVRASFARDREAGAAGLEPLGGVKLIVLRLLIFWIIVRMAELLVKIPDSREDCRVIQLLQRYTVTSSLVCSVHARLDNRPDELSATSYRYAACYAR